MINNEVDDILKFEREMEHQFIEDKQHLRQLYEDKYNSFITQLKRLKIEKKSLIDKQLKQLNRSLTAELDQLSELHHDELVTLEKQAKIHLQSAKKQFKEKLLKIY